MNKIIKRVEYINEDGETIICLHVHHPVDFVKVDVVLLEGNEDE